VAKKKTTRGLAKVVKGLQSLKSKHDDVCKAVWNNFSHDDIDEEPNDPYACDAGAETPGTTADTETQETDSAG
jgi:hypothetical protein